MPEELLESISVMIVDDHTIVRQGLKTLLELTDGIHIVGEAADGATAVALAAQIHPDVILMDLVMPGMDGITACQHICALGMDTKIIALTSFAEDDRVIPAIQAGATSFLLKDVSPADLVEAVRAAYRGEARLHPSITRRLMDQVARPPLPKTPADNLTGREVEVLRLVANGMSNREIGETLVISEKTVKSHVSSLLNKLSLEDRTQLAIFAIKNGMVEAG